jgi:chitin disaccharide deacetylase
VRRLIVNADDLGYDPAIDRGILEAHVAGLVRSTTAMVETPFAAAALAAAPRTLGIGLHAVLAPGLDERAALAALRRQLDLFEALRGAPPTHLDSHKHAHAQPAVLAAFIPVRSLDPEMRSKLRAAGIITPDRFLGDAALRPGWTAESLAAALDGLSDGVTELMSHPGHAPSHVLTSFGVEREIELAALTSPLCRAALARSEGVLCSFADIGG